MSTRYRLAVLGLVMLLSTGCDQATKQIAAATLKSMPPQSYLGDLFRLQYSENPGAFLSLGADLPEGARAAVFMIGVGGLLLGMLAFAIANRRLTPFHVVALALFLGGGVSNWVDRLVHGNTVVDFMNMGIGPLRTGIFNVADLYVVAGACMMFFSAFAPRRPEPAATVGQTETAGTGDEGALPPLEKPDRGDSPAQ